MLVHEAQAIALSLRQKLYRVHHAPQSALRTKAPSKRRLSPHVYFTAWKTLFRVVL